MSKAAGVASDVASPVDLPADSRYRVIGPLSAVPPRQGYLAEEIQSAGRVSLEVFDVGDSPEAEARFRQEAHLAARMSQEHPGLARLCEWGRLADGRPYVVCDDVEGRRLTELLAEGPLAVDRALSIAFQLAGTVEVLHNAGFVHTRLRPAVVILGEADAIKIAECHLAALLDPLHADRPPRERPPGERKYVAPEQMAGRRATERSDLYSLALILLEMLRGAFPSRAGDGAIAPSELQGVPRPIARILTRALDPEPGRRPTDASAYANDLYAARVQLQRGAGETRDPGRPRVVPGRSVAIACLASLLALAVAVTFAVTRPNGRRVEPTSDVAPPPERQRPVATHSEPPPADRHAPAPAPPPLVLPAGEAAARLERSSTPQTSPTDATRRVGSAVPGETASPPGEPRPPTEVTASPTRPPGEPTPPPARAVAAQPRSSLAVAPSPGASARETNDPDPAAIIDWLLRADRGKPRE